MVLLLHRLTGPSPCSDIVGSRDGGMVTLPRAALTAARLMPEPSGTWRSLSLVSSRARNDISGREPALPVGVNNHPRFVCRPVLLQPLQLRHCHAKPGNHECCAIGISGISCEGIVAAAAAAVAAAAVAAAVAAVHAAAIQRCSLCACTKIPFDVEVLIARTGPCVQSGASMALALTKSHREPSGCEAR